jgi:hypothetical protein
MTEAASGALATSSSATRTVSAPITAHSTHTGVRELLDLGPNYVLGRIVQSERPVGLGQAHQVVSQYAAILYR